MWQRTGVRWSRDTPCILTIGTYVARNIRATSLHAQTNPNGVLVFRDRSIRHDELRISRPLVRLDRDQWKLSIKK